MKKILLTFVILILLGGAGGAAYFLGYIPGEESAEDLASEPAEPVELPQLYLPLEPPFVVNFTHRGTLRYLQVSLELMYHDQTIIDDINEKMPAVRNALIMLFSNQDYESLSSYEGKEALRKSILFAVNDAVGMDAEVNDTGEAYFTNFVMQ